MVIEGFSPARKTLDPDWIQPAGNRLAERAFPLAETPLHGTQAVHRTIALPLITDIGTVLQAMRPDQPVRTRNIIQPLYAMRPVDDRRHQVTIPVNFKESLPLHRCPAFRGHQRGIGRIISLQLLVLPLAHRRTAVPDHATAAAAFLIITGEILRHDIRRNEHIPDLDDIPETIFHAE